MSDPLTIAILTIVGLSLAIKIYRATVKSKCLNNINIDLHKSSYVVGSDENLNEKIKH